VSLRDDVDEAVSAAIVDMLRNDLSGSPEWWALVREALVATNGDAAAAGKLIGQRLLRSDRNPHISRLVVDVCAAGLGVRDELLEVLAT